MKLEKIVNTLEGVLNIKLIVKKSHTIHPTFKGFVNHTIDLYEVVDKKPTKIFSIEKTIQPQMKEHTDDILEELFIKKLFETYAIK